jgi:hypothetical protein
MDSREFMDVVRLVVRDSAVSGTLDVLLRPPGRSPKQELKQMSTWYNSLDMDHRRMVAGVIKQAADSVVFGFLCVLDGVRAVEDSAHKGHFELRYVKDEATLLNPPGGEMLHDLFNAN